MVGQYSSTAFAVGHNGPTALPRELLDIQSSLNQLANPTTGSTPYDVLKTDLHTLCIFWISLPPTSRYHYRIRKRAEQWLISTAQILTFTSGNDVKWPYLTSAQYGAIVHLRDIVNSNPSKHQVAKDRDMLERHTGVSMDTTHQEEFMSVEVVDFMNIKAAYKLMVAAWGRLGEELKIMFGLADLGDIFEAHHVEEQLDPSAALEYWLVEVDLEFGELFISTGARRLTSTGALPLQLPP